MVQKRVHSLISTFKIAINYVKDKIKLYNAQRNNTEIKQPTIAFKSSHNLKLGKLLKEMPGLTFMI